MITGLPSTLNILEASNNRLTELNLDYPCNLHSINISHNLIDNIDGFSDLHCLRTLDMSYNNIKSCEPFGNFVSLLWLSLKGNNIKRLFFDQHEEYCLEYLDVSHNRIEILNRIESLAHLQELELGKIKFIIISLLLFHYSLIMIYYSTQQYKIGLTRLST